MWRGIKGVKRKGQRQRPHKQLFSSWYDVFHDSRSEDKYLEELNFCHHEGNKFTLKRFGGEVLM